MERYDSLGHEVVYNVDGLPVGTWWREAQDIRVEVWDIRYSQYLAWFGTYMADTLTLSSLDIPLLPAKTYLQ